MACADALLAPRPIEPTITKPAIESLLTLAVILHSFAACCDVKKNQQPAWWFPVSTRFWIGHFVVTGLL
jgi:hypothetical protein